MGEDFDGKAQEEWEARVTVPFKAHLKSWFSLGKMAFLREWPSREAGRDTGLDAEGFASF